MEKAAVAGLLLRVLGLVRWEEETGERMEVLQPFGCLRVLVIKARLGNVSFSG